MKQFPMTMSNNTQLAIDGKMPTAPTGQTWIARLRSLGASWTQRIQRNREIGELAAFSDRELWDLGLSRSDLMAISDGTYRRD